MTPLPTLELRDIAFEPTPQRPRYWHGGGRAVTLFFDNLSLFFPAGERFFVASVRANADADATDPQLVAAVRGFCAQEGAHSREHRRYNRWLAAAGVPVDVLEARVERLLARVGERADRRGQLAVTCALEHFTAVMADKLLRDPRLLADADPAMAALWRWHAAEEVEHKAVAFDVYATTGGGHQLRVVTMVGATAIFWAKVAEQQVRLMAADGSLGSPREWASLLTFLFARPGALRGVLRPWLAYFSPDFHPWQHDNHALLDAWRDAYAREPAYAAARRARGSQAA